MPLPRPGRAAESTPGRDAGRLILLDQRSRTSRPVGRCGAPRHARASAALLSEAREAFERALALARSARERRFLERRLAEL